MKRRSIALLFLILCAAGCGKKDVQKPPKMPEGNPVVELKQGNDLLAQKRCAEASRAYTDFLARYPGDAGGWNLLGVAQLCEGKLDLAVASLKRALELSPTFTDVRNNLGIAYMEMKKYPEARAEFLNTLEDKQYPASAPYFNLGRLAFIQGSFEESRALAKKVMEFSPKEIGPRLLYAASLMQLGRMDEALASAKESAVLDPKNAEAAFYTGTILAQKNQHCEARKYLNKVLDDDPLGDLGQQALQLLKTLPKCNP